MTNNELLSALYSLRAGLSVIYIEKEPLDVMENKAKETDSKIQEISNKISGKEESISIDQGRVSQIKMTIAKTRIPSPFSIENFFMSLCLAGALTLFGGELILYGLVSLFQWKILGQEVPMFNFPALLTYAAICFGLLFIIIRIYYLKTKTLAKRNEVKTMISNYRREISERESSIEGYKREISILNNKKHELKTTKAALVGRFNDERNVVVPTVKLMYNAFLTIFSPILDPRDWGSIDLIIFYLTTGRADSLKEALQLVDRQRQMDSLVAAIGEATISICQTIKVSINDLRKDMAGCFDRLSIQLSNQHNEQMAKLGAISSSIGSMRTEIGAKLDSIKSDTVMQTALLSKIDISSTKLADNAEHIAKYGIRSL